METTDALPEIAVFVAVVEEKSFTRAAERLKASKGYISRQVSQLEERLGAPLLIRTTRSMRLTDVGGAFYERSRAALAEIEDARKAVCAGSTSPRGIVRLSAPTSFGRHCLAPLLADFAQQFSDVSLDVVLVDRTVDVMAEGFDVAIEIGARPSSPLVFRQLGVWRKIACASPGYLRRCGIPKHPRELLDHRCLLESCSAATDTWALESRKEASQVTVPGAFRSNEPDILAALACSDHGIALLPEPAVSDRLARGELRHVLPSWWAQPRPVHAMYPENRQLVPKVRVLVEFLELHCSGLGAGPRRSRSKGLKS